MTNITVVYDNITTSNDTEYDNMTLSNCIFKENDFDINVPTIFLTIPFDLSFLCLMSLMVYTLIKTLLGKK